MKFFKKAHAEYLIKSLERTYFDLRKNHPDRDEHWFLANTWLKRYGSTQQAKQKDPELVKFIAYKDTHQFAILEPPKSIRGLALLLVYKELGEQLALHYANEFAQIMEPIIKSKENLVFLDNYKERNPRTWRENQEKNESSFSINMLLEGLKYEQEHPEEAEKLKKLLEETEKKKRNELREFKGRRKSGEIKIPPEWTTCKGDELMESAKELFRSGIVLIDKKDYQGAIPHFKEAIKKKPEFAEAYVGLGWVYDKLNNYKEAIDAFKEAIRLRGDFAGAYFNLGLIYSKLGRYKEEIESYNNAIRIKPDFAEAYYNLGFVYGDLGRHEEAIEAFKKAVRIKPDYAEGHFNLGLLYGDLGRYKEAVGALKEAIRIKPDYAWAHYVLGEGSLFLGDKSSALDEYKILKTLDPDLANELLKWIYK